ncbi:hypothetical protein CG471_09970 [Sphingobium sp. IP1]|nr:hypothetical protein CG471_09970 [Sphingobium sp. IP1]
MVVPPHYRGQIGKAEIKQSLCTDDLGEARRLGTARQHDWLKKFELIELGLKARDSLAGTDAIDGYQRWPGWSEQGSAWDKWIVCRFRDRTADMGRQGGRA